MCSLQLLQVALIANGLRNEAMGPLLDPEQFLDVCPLKGSPSNVDVDQGHAELGLAPGRPTELPRCAGWNPWRSPSIQKDAERKPSRPQRLGSLQHLATPLKGLAIGPEDGAEATGARLQNVDAVAPRLAIEEGAVVGREGEAIVPCGSLEVQCLCRILQCVQELLASAAALIAARVQHAAFATKVDEAGTRGLQQHDGDPLLGTKVVGLVTQELLGREGHRTVPPHSYLPLTRGLHSRRT
mmetsp:Transcript_63287/g.136049  ORF Transcript_63287/g.136049 Transcript_63287/m.136049 type:complete len:241 (+) Transcript_63287:1098-1820(+)